MADRASRESDKILHELESELTKAYDNANRQMQSVISSLLESIYYGDEEVTQRMRLKHAESNGLNELISIFTYYMLATNELAISTINTAMNRTATLNYTYMRSQVHAKANVDIGVTSEKYEANRYTRRSYNRYTQSRYVSNAILKELRKGIKLGEGVDKLQKRIRRVSDRNKNSAKLIARTESTRITNSSRLDALDEAKRLGVDFNKVWMATHDSRTREYHAHIDGEVVGADEKFSNGMQYPGDPAGGPENVCNCRCTLSVVIKE